MANPIARLTARLVAAVVVMFAFAVFLMPPLYDAFCEITGIGGKTGGRYEAAEAGVDLSRMVRVQFVATNNAAMPWDFKPQEYQVRVNPGESRAVKFLARNNTGRDMVAQAIPSVTPFQAAQYFHKTECFCFNRQELAAGAEAELPLVFIVDRDLPQGVNTITLSYTLFDVTNEATSGPGFQSTQTLATLN